MGRLLYLNFLGNYQLSSKSVQYLYFKKRLDTPLPLYKPSMYDILWNHITLYVTQWNHDTPYVSTWALVREGSPGSFALTSWMSSAVWILKTLLYLYWNKFMPSTDLKLRYRNQIITLKSSTNWCLWNEKLSCKGPISFYSLTSNKYLQRKKMREIK